MADKISDEDLNLLDMYKQKIYVYPLVGFFASLTVNQLSKYIGFPDFIKNPLKQQEIVQIHHSKMRKAISPTFIAFFTFIGFGFAAFQYEFCKYRIYRKYTQLIHQYLDACDEHYVSLLKQLQ
ncbi:hypothetical protein pb186bvf_006133 [Paramecium bursaria]